MNIYKKFYFSLFALVLTQTFLSAQQTWKYTYGSDLNDFALSAVQRDNGEYLVLCYTDTTTINYPKEYLYFTILLDSAGNQIEIDTLESTTALKMISLHNGDYLIGGTITDTEFDTPFLTRYSSTGQEKWTQIFPDTIENSGNNFSFFTGIGGSIVQLPDSTIAFASSYWDGIPDSGSTLITKVDSLGNIISEIYPGWDHVSLKHPLSNGSILLRINPLWGPIFFSTLTPADTLAAGYLPTSAPYATAPTLNTGGFIICYGDGDCYEVDENGVNIDGYQANSDIGISKILPLDNGSFIMAGSQSETPSSAYNDMAIARTFPPANSNWQQRKYYKPLGQHARDIIHTPDNGFLIIGYTETTLTGLDVYLIKVDSNGNNGSHLLTGNITHDIDLDCDVDTTENGLAGFVVVARGLIDNYGITDQNGFYNIDLDLGIYQVHVNPPCDYWDICINDIDIELLNTYDTTNVDFEAQAIIDCPYMEVDISTPLLRRCMNNTYFVNYCNNGTSTAEDVTIEVALDSFMVVDSTSIPISSVVGSTYIFEIGDLEMQECGSFNVYLTFDPTCFETSIGETYCVEAQVFPDSSCLPPPMWSGANIELDAECNPDSVSFFIQNTGTAPTSEILDFVIIEDEVILFQGNFDLGVGEVQTEKVPSNGSTYRMEAEQEPFHPFNKQVSITVEGCGENSMGTISTGYVNQYPDNDEAPSFSIDCIEVIGSFDPNDKQAIPIGYGEEHYIEQNIPIEYKIRFQNTGTDTAFTVVLLDTLSQFLNPMTVRPGASSHPYTYSISGPGIMEFRFDNIMLPDSNVNEMLSHGFVKFEIEQMLDNPIGSIIENSAAIYFDFNEPVITNTTFHEIGEDFIITFIVEPPGASQSSMTVAPNPFKEYTLLELEGEPMKDITLLVYNSMGQTVRSEQFESNRLQFYREQLISGIHFFQVVQNGNLISSGKMVVD